MNSVSSHIPSIVRLISFLLLPENTRSSERSPKECKDNSPQHTNRHVVLLGVFLIFYLFFYCALFQYWNRVLLFNLGFTLWPRTYREAHVGLKLMEIPLPQSHKYWGYWCYCISFHPNLNITLLHRSRINGTYGLYFTACVAKVLCFWCILINFLACIWSYMWHMRPSFFSLSI